MSKVIDSLNNEVFILDTVQSLIEYQGTATRIHILGYHSPGDGGGGLFFWDPDEDKSNHDGGTIIDPDKTFPSVWTDTLQQNDWFTAGTGTGCWKRIYNENKINVKWFGAVGNGSYDDSVVFQQCSDLMFTQGGGTIEVSNKDIYLIDSTITINVSVHLEGTHEFVGSPGTNNDAPYEDMRCALKLNPDHTILMRENSSLKGFIIYRKDMQFPEESLSGWTGTAVTAALDNGEDVAVTNCLIMGFDTAVKSSENQRTRIYNVWFDCLNGIDISECYDICYIDSCHGWNFATIEYVASGGSGDLLKRPGYGIRLHQTVDWGKITNSFTYGWYCGFEVVSSDCTLIGCGADNTSVGGSPTHTNSLGFNIGGNRVRLIGCQAAAQDSAAISINTGTDNVTTVVGFNAWAIGDHGVLLTEGDLIISSCDFTAITNGITIGSSTCRVLDGGGLRFEDVALPFNTIDPAITIENVRLSSSIHTNLGNGIPIIDASLPTITQTTVSPSIPTNAHAVELNGTASIGTLNRGWAGRQVTLLFKEAITVYNGGITENSIALDGAVNWNTTSSSTLTLLHDGHHWSEIGRKD